jgi:4-amino-4-deoxy-L-arabinose transferase-like glycosyltransferase
VTLTLRAAPPSPHPPGPAPTTAPAPRWLRRGALGALLAGTGVLYLWGLSASGWANAFYSAAAQAGSRSWTAWFFGSSDAANAITVDKTPAALWVTGLSVRLFGLSSWSILVPQALMGVATVALLYAAVRRTAGPAAGLLAGTVLALTPVAVLMFRFNNPDALLTLLLVGAAYATLRAVEAGRARWLVLAAALVGLGFLTKMLQAYLVLPAVAAAWLLAAPVGRGRRLRGLAAAAATLLVSSGWWVLAVELWPADRRPYIGGSQTNSVAELVLGYDGFGRLTGDEVGSVGGGPSGGWGETGLTRLFDAQLGGAASWLLPAALVLLGVLLWRTRRAPRTDALRAATVLWGGWLLVTAGVFSLMAGIFHDYYLVALAPAIAALVGVGGLTLWRARAALVARVALAGVVALSAAWAFVLLRRTPTWLPWLAWVVLGLGAFATLGLLLRNRRRPLAIGVATVALLAGLAGPTAYALATAATPHTGAIPSAGPAVAGLRGGPGGRAGGSPGSFRPQDGGAGAASRAGRAGSARTGTAAGNTADGTGAAGGTASGRSAAGGPGGFGRGGGFGGGLLGSPTPGAEVVTALERDASAYTWAAAAVGSNTAAGYQLATQLPVLAVGGFNGTDPAPTLEQFQQLVADGRVHWFVGADQGHNLLGNPSSGGSDQARLISEWVAATFTPVTVDGTVLYDLSAGAA